jgi:hypothetical protein
LFGLDLGSSKGKLKLKDGEGLTIGVEFKLFGIEFLLMKGLFKAFGLVCTGGAG